jgi:hypothetical protein
MFSVIKTSWHERWFSYVVSLIPQLEFPNSKFCMEWEMICQNENFLPKFIFSHEQYRECWDWKALCKNPNVTLSFILDCSARYQLPLSSWDWHAISRHKNMTPTVIQSNLSLPWVWNMIIYNPSVYKNTSFLSNLIKHVTNEYEMAAIINYAPLHFIKQYWEALTANAHFWRSLSSNPNLTRDFIVTYTQWNLTLLSANHCITPELLNDTLEWDWDWELISENPSIPFSFIEEHGDMEWNLMSIARTKVTPEFYEKYPDFFNMSELSINPHMMEYIAAHPDLPWDWDCVSHNKSLTYDFIMAHPEKPWSYTSSHIQQISPFHHNKELENTLPRLVFLKNRMSIARKQYINEKWSTAVKQIWENVSNQLMEVAWHPDRLPWVLDEEQKHRYDVSRRNL